jgi:catechol 2,3-dioxygenase-like lactoylglutathione lyase family enzyme
LLLALAVLLSTPAWAEQSHVAPTENALIGPAIFVSDVSRSLKFYVDGLGLKVGMEMGPADRHETILTFGGDPRNSGLILLSNETGSRPSPIEHGHGYDRTVLRIADLAGTQARLKAAGFQTTPIREVGMGYRMMVATDPDGYKYELVQTASRDQ